jgi:hypothetical protein
MLAATYVLRNIVDDSHADTGDTMKHAFHLMAKPQAGAVIWPVITVFIWQKGRGIARYLRAEAYVR